MLIESWRHRQSDRALWAELEVADMLRDVTARTAEAVSAIARFVDRVIERPNCYAGVSWGKDSVVIAHLLWLHARDVPLMHLRPTNHNPDCDAVRDSYFAKFPGQTYMEVTVDYTGIDRRNISQLDLDRLTDARWYGAIRMFEKSYGRRHILGIRGSESNGRRIRMRRWGLNSPHGCAPIGHWSSADVFAYLAHHSLPVHPAYAMLGAGRWQRERIRVAEIGDVHGTGSGRHEWEIEYYGDVVRRQLAACRDVGCSGTKAAAQ